MEKGINSSMLKKIKNRKSLSNSYLLLMSVLVFCIFQYGITKIYGMYLFPDEFGYWGSAATLLGYDWSEVIALGNYYSFGYSAILLPVLKFVKNATNAYRVAIFINAVFMCGGLYLMNHMLKKFWSKMDEKLLVFVSAIAVFYPSCIYYMQMTLTESLLTFLLLAISTVVLHYIENPKCTTAIGLAVLLCYLYFVHMRTVGIVIASILVVLWLALLEKKYRKSCMVFLMVLGLIGVCGYGLKEFILDNLYYRMTDDSLATNDYAGQIHKIIALFSIDGMIVFLMSCMGKLFYLGSATFGLFYWGMYYLIGKAIEMFKKMRRKEERNVHSMWFIFLLLTVVLHFMVGAVFSMERGPNGRIDALLYGRYNEIFVPLMLCIGIIAIFHSKKTISKTVLFVFVQGVFAVLLYYFIRTRELTQLYTCHIAGLRYAVDEMDFYIPEFLGRVVIVPGIISFLMIGIIMVVRKKTELFWLLGIILTVEIWLGVWASTKDIYLHNEDNYRDHELAEEIVSLGMADNAIQYIYTGGPTYVDLLQFYLRDTKFTVIDQGVQTQDELEQDDFILIDASNPYGDTLEIKYDSRLESGHFKLYYNTVEK